MGACGCGLLFTYKEPEQLKNRLILLLCGPHHHSLKLAHSTSFPTGCKEPSSQDHVSHYPNLTEGMNSRSGAKPEVEQRLCWACWCPQKNSVRQGCWLHLTRQEMWDFRNRTQKLTSLLSRRKINSPPVPELASFPQLSQTGYFVVLCSKTRKQPTTLAAAAACVIQMGLK